MLKEDSGILVAPNEPFTMASKILSLRNKNMRGDHYVTLVVQVPTSLSHEAKETLRKFDDETGKTLKAGGTAVKEEKKKKGFMGKLKDAVDDL